MSQVSLAVIVPMKSLSRAKQRLQPALSAAARQTLAQAMLEHVLETVAASGVADLAVLISADATILALGRRYHFEPLMEQQGGYNQVVAQGLNWAQEQGVASALILPADLPYLTPEELRGLAQHADAATPTVVLAPDMTESGTNALLLRPPGLMPPRFGPGSFARHWTLARRMGVEPVIYRAPGLARDIDWPADLLALRN